MHALKATDLYMLLRQWSHLHLQALQILLRHCKEKPWKLNSHAAVDIEPKRPPSAYFLFAMEARDRAKALGDDLSGIAKTVLAEWKHMSEERRKGFEAKALELKIQHDRQMAEYRKQR